MAVVYVRRFRMEFEFGQRPLPPAVLPDGYAWIAWTRRALGRHTAALYEAFREEIDARVFACFRSYRGCRRLMRSMASQAQFLPAATWIITRRPFDEHPADRHDPHLEAGAWRLNCATIQGLQRARYAGSIQNVGVVPAHRGLGLGRALVLKSLHGFRSRGLRRVSLEVTAENEPAVALYRSIGFHLSRTVYKGVPADSAILPVSPTETAVIA
jgi:ribosomal protein S18 acetylase RimI-like enzyme